MGRRAAASSRVIQRVIPWSTEPDGIIPGQVRPQRWWLSFLDRDDDAELGSVAVQLGLAIVIARDILTTASGPGRP
jgi:hypothetical protein